MTDDDDGTNSILLRQIVLHQNVKVTKNIFQTFYFWLSILESFSSKEMKTF